MSKIYLTPVLINFEYLSAYSPIPINYNWEDIRPFVKIAEEIWIKDIIGKKLYEELLKEVSLNKISETNSTLLLHVYELEAIAICLEALPFLAYNVTEKGITKTSSSGTNTTETINAKEFSEIKNDLRTKIEVLKVSLKDFLDSNKDCYPLYKDANDIVGKNKPNDNLRIFGSNK